VQQLLRPLLQLRLVVEVVAAGVVLLVVVMVSGVWTGTAAAEEERGERAILFDTHPHSRVHVCRAGKQACCMSQCTLTIAYAVYGRTACCCTHARIWGMGDKSTCNAVRNARCAYPSQLLIPRIAQRLILALVHFIFQPKTYRGKRMQAKSAS
jgi:hypothetical protein